MKRRWTDNCLAKFHGAGGWPGERYSASSVFKLGERYKVVGADVGQSVTFLTLKGIDGSWNSDLFDIEGELIESIF